jgi:hypothetical protein
MPHKIHHAPAVTHPSDTRACLCRTYEFSQLVSAEAGVEIEGISHPVHHAHATPSMRRTTPSACNGRGRRARGRSRRRPPSGAAGCLEYKQYPTVSARASHLCVRRHPCCRAHAPRASLASDTHAAIPPRRCANAPVFAATPDRRVCVRTCVRAFAVPRDDARRGRFPLRGGASTVRVPARLGVRR